MDGVHRDTRHTQRHTIIRIRWCRGWHETTARMHCLTSLLLVFLCQGESQARHSPASVGPPLAFAAPAVVPCHRLTGGRKHLCMKHTQPHAGGENMEGRRKAIKLAIGLLLPVLSAPGPASASAPQRDVLRMEASTPEIAYDVVILMRSTRALREAGDSLKKGDPQPILSWLSTDWHRSGGGRTNGPNPRKSLDRVVKVLEDDAEVVELTNKMATLEQALSAPSPESVLPVFLDAVESFDRVLRALKMPPEPCTSDWSCDFAGSEGVSGCAGGCGAWRVDIVL